MPRIAKFLPIAATALFAAGCTGESRPSPDSAATLAAPDTTVTLAARSAPELDQVIDRLVADLFPDALEKEVSARWSDVKRSLADGQAKEAHGKYVDLAEWIGGRTAEMENPTGNETREQAATRLVYYMGRHIHDDKQPVPELGRDAAFGVVRPGKAVTIVTPARTAGVALPQGAVSEPIVVLVAQNPKPFKDNCRGPLDTRMCQYPLFYRFESFPVVQRLNRPGRFGVCHVTKGPRKPTDDVHERVALGHSGPPDGSSFSEGARRVDRIELPKPVDVRDFMYCKPDSVDYEVAAAPVTGSPLERAWSALAAAPHAVFAQLGPRTAYATMRVDQGIGGEGHFFDDYNVVDPQSGGDQ